MSEEEFSSGINPFIIILGLAGLVFIGALALSRFLGPPQASVPRETKNLEEWIIEEDESGRLIIRVHRHVRRA